MFIEQIETFLPIWQSGQRLSFFPRLFPFVPLREFKVQFEAIQLTCAVTSFSFHDPHNFPKKLNKAKMVFYK